jgi:hypothetical protein
MRKTVNVIKDPTEVDKVVIELDKVYDKIEKKIQNMFLFAE